MNASDTVWDFALSLPTVESSPGRVRAMAAQLTRAWKDGSFDLADDWTQRAARQLVECDWTHLTEMVQRWMLVT